MEQKYNKSINIKFLLERGGNLDHLLIWTTACFSLLEQNLIQRFTARIKFFLKFKKNYFFQINGVLRNGRAMIV